MTSVPAIRILAYGNCGRRSSRSFPILSSFIIVGDSASFASLEALKPRRCCDICSRVRTDVREEVRRHYVVYASHLEHLLGRMPSIPAPRLEVPTQIRVEVFPWINGGHSPDFCQVRNMPAGQWHTLVFDLRYPDMNGPLRIDTGYEPSFVEIGDIVIHSTDTGQILWQSPAVLADRGLQFGGTARPLPNNPSFIINIGDDPNFLLKGAADVRGPVILTITLKVLPVAKAAMEIIHSHLQTALADASARMSALESQVHQMTSVRDREQAELNNLRHLLIDIQNSASWQITSPMRMVMAAFRRGKA